MTKLKAIPWPDETGAIRWTIEKDSSILERQIFNTLNEANLFIEKHSNISLDNEFEYNPDQQHLPFDERLMLEMFYLAHFIVKKTWNWEEAFEFARKKMAQIYGEEESIRIRKKCLDLVSDMEGSVWDAEDQLEGWWDSGLRDRILKKSGLDLGLPPDNESLQLHLPFDEVKMLEMFYLLDTYLSVPENYYTDLFDTPLIEFVLGNFSKVYGEKEAYRIWGKCDLLMEEYGNIDDAADSLVDWWDTGMFDKFIDKFEDEEENISENKDSIAKMAAWSDVMEKAKRYVDENRINIQVNNWTVDPTSGHKSQHVMSVVDADTGEWTTEIWKDDPTSRAITRWDCNCPWGQVSWGRTRQWQKYEGRPCAHTLALHWKTQMSAPPQQQMEQEVNKQPIPGQINYQQTVEKPTPTGQPTPAPTTPIQSQPQKPGQNPFGLPGAFSSTGLGS